MPVTADREAVQKSYRALAKRWHLDRNRGEKAAEVVFAAIASAYDTLMDPEKRDIFDRLGASGLERHRDGDPSVHKDWLPPDEVLPDPREDRRRRGLLRGSRHVRLRVAYRALRRVRCSPAPALRWLVGERVPSVRITASDASGAALASGGSTAAAATFMFLLNGKSFDFTEDDVVAHNCARAKFLGMKTTFYLQCAHDAGADLAISIAGGSFSVAGMRGTNAPTEPFLLRML